MFDETVFVAVVWSFFGVATFTAFLRFPFQQRMFMKPYDHFLSLLSLFTFLSTCVVNTILAARYFHLSGQNSRGYESFYKLQFGSTILYISCLWLVKTSLLTSYYNLIDSFQLLKYAWHSILWMIIVTYFCCFASYPFAEPACVDGSISLSHIKRNANVCV